tara:strand:+ start:1261 stop:1998 length:738 start_codon:yes stop_codon:yes gene_type:complete
MAGEGRTLFEHFKEKVKGSVESRFKNPLGKKIGTAFTIDDPEYSDDNFRLEAIREVKRTIGDEDFYYSDYDLLSKDGDHETNRRVRLRFCPLADPDPDSGQTHCVLLLHTFDEFEYEEGFHKGILLGQMQDGNDWVDDPAFEGGFCVDDESDGEVDSTFWRVNDVRGAHEATVKTVADTDGDGTAEIEEVKESQVIYWDYWRETKDEVGDTITDFVFVDMDEDTGYLTLWRGQEVDPNRVVVLGR